MSNVEGSFSRESAGNDDVRDVLGEKVESWRDRLLDLGNRNALINTRFSERSSIIEFDTPSTEEIWVKLAAESAAGVDPMRFPWRRDLVPPPNDWQEYEDGPNNNEASNPAASTLLAAEQSSDPLTVTLTENLNINKTREELLNHKNSANSFGVVSEAARSASIHKRKRREWNPPLDECRRSPHLRRYDLLVDRSDKVLDRKLRNLDGDARLAMSEQGVHALYVAFGFLKWYESVDSTEEKYSPLMLVPVTLSRDSTSAPWELTEAEDDAVDNLCLRQRLWQDFKLALPPLPDINELEESGAREQFLDAVRAAIEKHDRWEVVDKCVIGRFAFPKIAMWKDLGDHKRSVTEHALCRALGGDESAIGTESFGPVSDVPKAKELDDVLLPGEIKTILDCDSSQLEAIVAARKGVSFVLDGPPGTGKSQTIANIIADALSLGRTVLFVSEKISALEVVKQRLEARQLDDFCLECHSDKANRRTVLFEMQRCLDLPAEVYQDTSPKLDELSDQRSRLNNYVRRIHEPHEPLGLSAFELFGRVSHLTNRGLAQLTRCKLPDLFSCDRATFDGWMRLLGRAGDVEEVIIRHDGHPWRGCQQTVRSLSIHDDLQHHFITLSEHFNRVSVYFDQVIDQGLLAPVTPVNLKKTIRACEQALMVPNTPEVWFEAPGETAAAVLALLTAETRRSTILNGLGCFIEGVEHTFPVEAARAVNSEADELTSTAIHGLKTLRSATVRERLAEIGLEIERLAPVAEGLKVLETASSEHTKATGLSFPKHAGIEQLCQLGKATRLAAAAGPARPQWLISKDQMPIRSLAEKALTFVIKNEALAESVRDVIVADKIPAIAEILQEAGRGTSTLSRAVALGLSDRLSLEMTRTSIVKAIQFVEAIATAVRLISKALGDSVSDESITIPILSTEKMQNALQNVEQAGCICGSWRDASIREALRRASADAIQDLADAAVVRESLDGRLSHRAFRESASSLAARGVVYSSALKRWFGGFRAFRAEVAELYCKDVPNSAVLAQDMAALQKYHRRIRDVLDEADELKDHLPSEFKADESTSWDRVKLAVTAIDQLAAAWPDAVASLSIGVHAVTLGELTGPAARLASATTGYNQLVSEIKLDLPIFGSMDVSSVKAALDDLQWALDSWGDLWDQCEEYTRRPIASLAELDQLITALAKYSNRHTELRAAAEKYSNWLPEGSDPTTACPWQAMLNGVGAVQQFISAGTDIEELQRVWCHGGFGAREATLSTVGKRLDEAATAIQSALESASIDTGLTPLGEVKSTIARAMKSLMTERARLTAVSETLREHQDVAVEDLFTLADRITELRVTQSDIERAKLQLNDLGIGDVKPSDFEAAKWLAQAMVNRTIDPLEKAVASDEAIRQQVTEALTAAKSVVSDSSFKEGWRFLKTLFDLRTEVSDGYVIAETPLGELAEKLKWLLTHVSSFDMWQKFASWKRDVAEAGLGMVIEELVAGRYRPTDAADVVAVQLYRQLFDRLAQTDRALGNFDVDEHERIRERFRFLDEWEVKAASSRIRQYQLGRDDRPSSNFLGAESSELGILQNEIAKKRKHKPLRRLFAEIPTVLQRLKPCIMMSPLSVSTFLDTDDIRFDLVIFDEASQVFPWDALGAIYRGKQLIVAGDDKQLPPTNFFNRADSESDDDEEDIGDYESILSLCKSIGMPNQRLKWHYRSRREPLIAFSNRHFYNGELVTFPSVYDARGDGVRLEHVPEGRWVDRKNHKEAERIVEMIVAHVRTKPDKSLGIIALNQSQQLAIEDTLYDLKRDRPEVDALFDGSNYFGGVHERLFIKNLENVQGDERDVIFLSMGYGFNDAGKFNKNFGPINRQNGERRLNVAVTRAREELVFVSSVRAADMDLTSSKSEGAHLLKAYLNYAEKGVDTLGLAIDEFAAETESPFEEEVATALVQRGLEPVPQVGCGGFRIDLALKHPNRPGEFCLAVECDGATYHSSHTARDRDRIRQNILEKLGWRIVRIWSTDWIRDPDRQIDRVIGEYDAAVAMSPPAYQPSASANDEDELEPQYIEKSSSDRPVNPKFGNIDDVPDSVIHSTAAYVLTQAGAMAFDDLIKQTSRELGFRRLGGKIKSRIADQLGHDLETGRLKRFGERVTKGEQSG